LTFSCSSTTHIIKQKSSNIVPSQGISVGKANQQAINMRKVLSLWREEPFPYLSCVTGYHTSISREPGLVVSVCRTPAETTIPSPGTNKQHLPQPDGTPFCSWTQEIHRQLLNGKKRTLWIHHSLLRLEGHNLWWWGQQQEACCP
jgi:hypothetical protein